MVHVTATAGDAEDPASPAEIARAAAMVERVKEGSVMRRVSSSPAHEDRALESPT
jgi:hypothetical protein